MTPRLLVQIAIKAILIGSPLVCLGMFVFFEIYKARHEHTIYANSYSEEQFNSLKDGDTKELVLEKIGKPLDVVFRVGQANDPRTPIDPVDSKLNLNPLTIPDLTEIIWVYSAPAEQSKANNTRWVTFAPNYRIIRITSTSWFD